MDGKGYLIEFDYNNGGNSKLIYLPIPPQLEERIGIVGKIKIEVDRVIDWNKLLKALYPSYKIINCESIGKGHPDFKLVKGQNTIYIECKQGSDSLRYSQMEWIFNAVRSGKKVRGIFFKSEEVPDSNNSAGENTPPSAVTKSNR